MGRRRHTEEHVNHERWLVSYADFITLLFAFFVVMYSISQVNESKYRVLSNTLENAFNQPDLSMKPIQIGETAKSNPTSLIKLNADAIKDKIGKNDEGDRRGGEKEGDMPDEFKQIANKIEQAFGDLMKQNLVTLRGNEEWLEVEMNSSLLFDSGDATLSNKSLELLAKIADIINQQKNPVRVEGFTDDRPIHNSRFPSNWALSSARAAAVVELFIEQGLDASRLMAAGYGEYQPVVPNDSPENRAKNRRVVLMISKTGSLRPVLKEINPSGTPETNATENVQPEVITNPIDTGLPAPSADPAPQASTPAATQSLPSVPVTGANTGKTP